MTPETKKRLEEEWKEFATSISKKTGVMQHHSLKDCAEWWFSKIELLLQKKEKSVWKRK
jgi:hypothetical protein